MTHAGLVVAHKHAMNYNPISGGDFIEEGIDVIVFREVKTN